MGVQTWMYGYKEYTKSPAVFIATSEMRYVGTPHIGWCQHNFEFGPDGQFMVVGWQVISNWNDGTNGQWQKNLDQILLTNRASIRVQSQFWRGCDWTVRIFYVRKSDYQFDDTETAVQEARPTQTDVRIQINFVPDGTLTRTQYTIVNGHWTQIPPASMRAFSEARAVLNDYYADLTIQYTWEAAQVGFEVFAFLGRDGTIQGIGGTSHNDYVCNVHVLN